MSTAGLGLYDQVLPYEQVDALPRDRGTVLVDMAGDAGIRAGIHQVTDGVLRASIMVGATHWTQAGFDGSGLPGPSRCCSSRRARPGRGALPSAYASLVEGDVDPRKGMVFTL